MYDMLRNKPNYLLVCHVLQRNCFSPLSKRISFHNHKAMLFSRQRMYLANEIQSPASEWPRLDNWMQQRNRHRLNISVLLTLFTSYIVPKTIGYHGRPIKVSPPKKPILLGSQLMIPQIPSWTSAVANRAWSGPKHFKSKSYDVRRYDSSLSRVNLSVHRRIFLSLILLGSCKYLTRGVLHYPTSSSTVLEETVAEVGFPLRGGLTGPRGRSDWGTRFDRPEGAVEPTPPEHNPQLS
jgi:hypothetical protein